MKYRNRWQIIANLLQATEQELTFTRILQKVGLNTFQLNDILSCCLKANLLSNSQSRKPIAGKIRTVYKRTEKGLAFIETVAELNIILESV